MLNNRDEDIERMHAKFQISFMKRALSLRKNPSKFLQIQTDKLHLTCDDCINEDIENCKSCNVWEEVPNNFIWKLMPKTIEPEIFLDVLQWEVDKKIERELGKELSSAFRLMAFDLGPRTRFVENNPIH